MSQSPVLYRESSSCITISLYDLDLATLTWQHRHVSIAKIAVELQVELLSRVNEIFPENPSTSKDPDEAEAEEEEEDDEDDDDEEDADPNPNPFSVRNNNDDDDDDTFYFVKNRPESVQTGVVIKEALGDRKAPP